MKADISLQQDTALLVDKRDLCLFRYWESEESLPLRSAMLMAQSVVHDAVPEVKGTVRAELAECGIKYTDCTCITSLDLKGQLPSIVVNLMLLLSLCKSIYR